MFLTANVLIASAPSLLTFLRLLVGSFSFLNNRSDRLWQGPKTIFIYLSSVKQQSSFELLRVDQEAGDMDEVKPNCQEEALLALSLEHELDTRLAVVPQTNQTVHAFDEARNHVLHNRLLNAASKEGCVKD